jgi:hypothetical protein
MESYISEAIMAGPVIILALLAGFAGSQAAAPYTSVIEDMREREYAPVRQHLLAAARLMPADAYDFRAAEGTRTFGEEIAHVAGVNLRLCALASGATSRPPSPAVAPRSEPSDRKAGLIDSLERSFSVCDAVLKDATDDLLLRPTTGRYIRASHLTALLGHINHEYGKLSIMLRMKGLVPPSTAAKPQ